MQFGCGAESSTIVYGLIVALGELLNNRFLISALTTYFLKTYYAAF